MEVIKDSEGKVLFEGTIKLVSAILKRYDGVKEILTEEGHKFDKDALLQDCIGHQIDFERENFENSFTVHF